MIIVITKQTLESSPENETLLNLKVIVIVFGAAAPGTFLKGLKKGLEEEKI